MILDAVTAWSNALNADGTVLTMTETDYNSAQLKVSFAPQGGACGEGPSISSMVLASDYYYLSSSTLRTTVLHEMGHVFLGSGHHSGSFGVLSCPYGNNCDLIGGISGEESDRARNLYNPNIMLNLKNVFGDGSGGGQMIVGTETITLQSSGYTPITRRTSQFPLTLQAKTGQTSGGFPQNFTEWTGTVGSSNLSIPINGSGEYAANFKDLYTVTVRTSHPAGLFPGKMRIDNGPEVTSPATLQVQQGNSVEVQTTTSQTVDAVSYSFVNWTPFGYTTQPATYHPSRTEFTYTANFSGLPAPPGNMHAGGTVGDHVHVTWDQHPSPYVTRYHIWRVVKNIQNGTWGEPYEIAVIQRDPQVSSYSYTDYSYLVSASSSYYLLQYDVRSYFWPNGTYSGPVWTSAWGENPPIDPRADDGRIREATIEAIPSSFSVSNYPNPFNPSTTVSFSLPKEAVVTLEIYNVLGEKVRTLIEGQNYRVGRFTIAWDGRDESAKVVPGGMYFYRIIAGEYFKTVKMMLMK
jgi:hypothetical protein